MTPPVRCAIVGCGMVADEYATTLRGSHAVDLVACTDLDIERARAFAVRHQIPSAIPFRDLLRDGLAELLIVLTPPGTHLSVVTEALTAGICAYVEKPLALTGDDAAELVTLAEKQRVLLGAAPDTFLAPPTRAAAASIAAGHIGEPVAASAALLTSGPERWHPEPEGLYEQGTGPLLDMGPYYLTQLVDLLGPITRVDGATATTRPVRMIGAGPRAGQTFRTQALTHVEALLQTAAGVTITFTASSDVHATTRPHLEIYGTEGTLVLPDPNFHHGLVRLRLRGQPAWSDMPPHPSPPDRPVGRGMGVLDLAAALRNGESHRATGRQALHVCHVMDAIKRAVETSAAVQIAGTGWGLPTQSRTLWPH